MVTVTALTDLGLRELIGTLAGAALKVRLRVNQMENEVAQRAMERDDLYKMVAGIEMTIELLRSEQGRRAQDG